MGESLLAMALLLAAAQPPASSSQAPALADRSAADISSLAWLEGHWRVPAAAMRVPGEVALEVRPALGAAFLEFSYSSGRFQGRAFYRPGGAGRWTATWFDNRAVSFGITAVESGRTLTADWGSDATERGRTIYRLAEDGRLHITDSVRGPDGTYRQFAAHIFTRAE